MTRSDADVSRNAALHEDRLRAVPRGVSATTPIYAVRARGATVWDTDGRAFVDFAGGIGVMNTGHAHPRVVQAVQAQLERFTHTCFQVVGYEGYVRLAERLNALVPGDFQKKTMFVSTGAEAVENAVKIARSHTGRPAVVAFQHGFHGRTLLGMSLTGKVHPYKAGFGPFAPDVHHVPFPYVYRGVTVDAAVSALRDLFRTRVAPDSVAAVIIEPVLGEGGFVPAPAEFLRTLRDVCDRHGILLIADEVQTGFGRTGRMFAMEHAGVTADIVTTAKSLAAGLPLAGVTGRADVMDAPDVGGLGGTYAGNPLAVAAALAVLDVFEEENVLPLAERQAERVRATLDALAKQFANVGDVRGLGAMLAVELVQDRGTRAPDTAGAARVAAAALTHGLIVLRAGMDANVIRVLAPLNATEDELTVGLEALTRAFADAYATGT